ncbi:MAG TPA: NAD(P)H-dependent oxidoreductase subunit E [Planctomycetia bacterium]|nr:NAD(P)H-dependent oxidoreductase subunit E [Planctomycetia bacterium]
MKKEILTKEPPIDLETLEREIASFNRKLSSGDLIAILQKTQDAYGYLPRGGLEFISRETSIPLARIFGVATFYAQFSFIPKGKYTIRVCTGTACHVRGAGQVVEELERNLGIKEGDTTKDLKFTLQSVACLGTCALGPIVVVGSSVKSGASCCDTPFGHKVALGDKFYGQVAPEKVEEILENYREA